MSRVIVFIIIKELVEKAGIRRIWHHDRHQFCSGTNQKSKLGKITSLKN
jgi:hypothetical protein